MADRRSKRRRMENKKAFSSTGVVAAMVSTGAIIIWGAFVVLASMRSGDVANVVAGISVLAYIASIVSLVFGIRAFSEKQFSFGSRLAGVIVPGIATAVWSFLYLTGLLLS